MRVTPVIVAALLGASVLATPLASHADRKKQVRFLGIHPIPRSEGGGVCHIEGPHVHIFGADKLQYREHPTLHAHAFVGDPVAYGWDGPKHAYKGHHPIHVHVEGDASVPDEVEFCYLDGPHYHAFAPPPGPEFEVRADVAFYVAEPPKVYIDERPTLVKINAVYTPIVYTRPQVTVEAPALWVGVRYPVVVVAPPPPVVVAPSARVDIVTPRVDIVVPNVRVDVGIGIGVGVGVGGHVHHQKYKKHKKQKGRGRW